MQTGYKVCDEFGKDRIFKIEARALLKGLQIAWKVGIMQIELECDNVILVELILVGNAANNNISELRLIHQLSCRSWKVRVRHAPRDHNRVANHMAKIANFHRNNLHIFKDPPVSVKALLVEDTTVAMLGRNVGLPRLFSRRLVSPGQIQITVMIFLIGCLVHSEILVKINVEYAITLWALWAASHVSATGVVVQDMEGFVLGACTRFNRAISDSFAVEALACLQALHFAKDMGF
ncbi:hypothetical protein CXB51_034466 [Gossypium anomalum]|uniref:RNase H type-1 domain-containing protein n=1 Tax=Gossypium anomalum TaxID=47600 RepID=A0A8J6CGZ1_9ROSI|nr:hypothetical protein CXB51_034466 [Gossypium anomalum]